MKKVDQHRKLQLSPEIIRNLDAEEMQQVQGGSASFTGGTCAQSNNSCSGKPCNAA